MKTFRLLIAALLFAATASAQRYGGTNSYGRQNALSSDNDTTPVVYMISVQEAEEFGNPSSCCSMQQHITMNNMSARCARQDYDEVWRTGFQQPQPPTFIFASKNNRFSLALGGYINLRAAYDFDGAVDNVDFVPAAIPMSVNYNNRQQFMMDASTSRLYMMAIGNTNKLGRVVVYIDADFRGSTYNRYIPRLRSAYVSMLGLTVGRDVTTFCDLDAAPTTVDFRGPNAYNLRFATMIRYEIPFLDEVMKFGVAAEMPDASGTYNDRFRPLAQRMPDFPMYLQATWGRNRQNHLRASAVLRNMYFYDTVADKSSSLFGWGVQASGRLNLAYFIDLYFNGVYGKGITPYLQDLEGSGLDFAPDPTNPDRMQTSPMWGWQAAAQFNIVPTKLTLAGGYSMVRVEEHNGFISQDEYRQGQYIFGNIFYHITPRFKVAAEYLYGTRKNMSWAKNHANRVQLMAQYNF